MRYQGPIYRPPSEADSLLIQATIGCPHNKCTFCMVYKNGPPFRIRSVKEIKEDLLAAKKAYGSHVSTLFLPAGNTIAMKTDDLCEVLKFSRQVFPELARITVYGSSQYIHQKGPEQLQKLADAGLSRIHVGFESGDDVILKKIRKGTRTEQQVTAGRWVMQAGIELSLYVILGIGGTERTRPHATLTAEALSRINPDFIRLRTFVPKVNTQMLQQVETGEFTMLGPLDVLAETALLIEGLEVTSYLASDHYTNYINLDGRLPHDKPRLMGQLEKAMEKDEADFRSFFVGTQ